MMVTWTCPHCGSYYSTGMTLATGGTVPSMTCSCGAVIHPVVLFSAYDCGDFQVRVVLECL